MLEIPVFVYLIDCIFRQYKYIALFFSMEIILWF